MSQVGISVGLVCMSCRVFNLLILLKILRLFEDFFVDFVAVDEVAVLS